MVDQRGRAIHVFIAIDLGAVAHIDIFQIGKMALIKISDLFKSRTAVDCRAGAGGKYLIGLGIIGHRPSSSAADTPADHRIQVSGAVDEIRVIHLDHLAADREDSGGAFNSAYHFFNIMRIYGSIIVQQDDVGRPGVADADIDRFAEAIVLI